MEIELMPKLPNKTKFEKWKELKVRAVKNAQEKIADEELNPVKVKSLASEIASGRAVAADKAMADIKQGAQAAGARVGLAAGMGLVPGAPLTIPYMALQGAVGLSGLGGARTLYRGLMAHPDILEKLIPLEGVGDKISRAVRKLGPRATAPLVYALYHKDKRVKKIVDDSLSAKKPQP